MSSPEYIHVRVSENAARDGPVQIEPVQLEPGPVQFESGSILKRLFQLAISSVLVGMFIYLLLLVCCYRSPDAVGIFGEFLEGQVSSNPNSGHASGGGESVVQLPAARAKNNEVVNEAVQKSEGSLYVYHPSKWEELWLNNIERWQRDHTICEALEQQKEQVHTFMKDTCSATTDTDWCLIDDSVHQLWYNTHDGRVAVEKPPSITAISPLQKMNPKDDMICQFGPISNCRTEHASTSNHSYLTCATPWLAVHLPGSFLIGAIFSQVILAPATPSCLMLVPQTGVKA
jgi:hypothetical protein